MQLADLKSGQCKALCALTTGGCRVFPDLVSLALCPRTSSQWIMPIVPSCAKDKLADFAGELERDGTFDDNLKMYDGSIKFFKEMAKVIEGAKLRLLVGDAVYGM